MKINELMNKQKIVEERMAPVGVILSFLTTGLNAETIQPIHLPARLQKNNDTHSEAL